MGLQSAQNDDEGDGGAQPATETSPQPLDSTGIVETSAFCITYFLRCFGLQSEIKSRRFGNLDGVYIGELFSTFPLSHITLFIDFPIWCLLVIFGCSQLAIESPPSHIIVLGFLNGALNSLKRDFSRMFAILYGRPNIEEAAR